MTAEFFHDQSSQKYWIQPGSKSGPLDLQSDLLLGVLRGPVLIYKQTN